MAKPLDEALIKQLFQLADEDRDGAVGGAEAVKFFARSGLGQECLGQVWGLASNGAPKLNMTQFGTALRLVCLAQINSGRLPLDQARTTMAGLGPVLPAPRLTGLDQVGLPSYSPQSTGGASYQMPGPGTYAPQNTGGYTTQTTGGGGGGYAPQTTGGSGYAAQATGSYVAQGTGGAGGGYVAQTTGGQGGYPPPSAVDLQRYQALFVQLDTDRDGIVQGGDCFNTFLQWGLDKAVLKDVWDRVAGNAGHLTNPQFCQALNLMDLARRSGGVLPAPQQPQPLGMTPSVAAAHHPQPAAAHAGGWSLASQFASKAPTPAGPTLPVAPIPPQRFDYQEPANLGPTAVSQPSRVPPIPNVAFTDTENAKLAMEAREAAAKETQLRMAQDEATKSKARVRAYNEALQELAVFKSRNNVALLEAQDLASRLAEEASSTQKKYELAYNAAQNAGEESKKAVDKVQSLLTAKAEAEEKLRKLQQELAEADHQLAPAQVYQLQTEVSALQLQVDQAEVFKKSKMQQIDAMRGQKVALESKLKEVQEALWQADAELESAAGEVSRLQAAAEQLRGQGNSGGQAQAMLVRAARAYRSLLATVLRCGLELPFEADLLNNGGLLVQGKNESTGALLAWTDDVMAGVADWTAIDADAQGYVLVNATDARLPAVALMPARGMSTSFRAPPPAAAAAAVTGGAPQPAAKAAFSVGFGDEEDDAFAKPAGAAATAAAAGAGPAAAAAAPPPPAVHVVPPLPGAAHGAAAATPFPDDDDPFAPSPASITASAPEGALAPSQGSDSPSPQDPAAEAAATHAGAVPLPAFGEDLAFGAPPAAAAEPPPTHAAAAAPAAHSSAAEATAGVSPFATAPAPVPAPPAPPAPPPPPVSSKPLDLGFGDDDLFGAKPEAVPPPLPPPPPAAALHAVDAAAPAADEEPSTPPAAAPAAASAGGFGAAAFGDDASFGESAFGTPPAFPPAPVATHAAAPAPAAVPPPPAPPAAKPAAGFALAFDDDAF